MLRTSASVDGISVAPAMPRTARVPMSAPASWAYAEATDAIPNAVPPISSRSRRPMRSPSVPIMISNPASTNP
jgi:hypothetical protein